MPLTTTAAFCDSLGKKISLAFLEEYVERTDSSYCIGVSSTKKLSITLIWAYMERSYGYLTINLNLEFTIGPLLFSRRCEGNPGGYLHTPLSSLNG